MFTGEQTYDAATAYIQAQFVAKNKDTNKWLYWHHTCATDTENIEFVFDALTDVVVASNLGAVGLY